MQVRDGQPGDVWESQLICSLRQQQPLATLTSLAAAPVGWLHDVKHKVEGKHRQLQTTVMTVLQINHLFIHTSTRSTLFQLNFVTSDSLFA